MLSDAKRAAMAARLRQGRAAPSAGIPRREPGADVPLSYGQEQLWFIDQIAPGLPTYNIAGCFRLRGPLDVAALGRALDRLVARHEALRTRLVAADGPPLQVVDDPAPVPLPVEDLTEEGEYDFVRSGGTRPFSLAEGPLLRASLGRRSAEEHLLLVVVHHTVFDGWSLGVLQRELAALYGEEAAGEEAALAELPVQFGDYAVWERGRLQGESLQALADWWRNALAGAPTVQLPTDRPRALLEDFKGAVVRRPLERALVDGVQELARQEGTTPFVVLLAAFNVLLHRHTGDDDLVIGTPSANRTRPELSSLIGYLVNTLPIRTDVSGDPTFTELVRRVRDVTVGAYTHQELPFAKMVEVLGVERDPSRAPLAQILFLHAEDTAGAPPSGAGVEFGIAHHYADPGTAKLDLTFAVTTTAGKDSHVLAQYATALFDGSTIDRMLGHYAELLSGVIEDPGRRISELPLLTDEELHRELVEWNDTARELRIDCFHRRFEEQAARTPEVVAAELDDDRLTYDELNTAANRIARRLHDLEVGPEVLVGVSMAASPRRLAAVMGILKAGGGYVPLDPDLPDERLAYMIGNAGISVVLCDEASEAALPDTGATHLSVDREWAALARLDGTNPDYPVETNNVAYVIYTSGSTGTPKGVVVEHGQAMHVVLGLIERFGIGPGDRVLQFASLNFDVSVADVFATLLSGATAVIGSKETLHTPPRLAELIGRGVTIAGMPPAVLSLLPVEEFPSLRLLMPAGEELPSEVARAWVRPGLQLCNAYGPTEACVYSTIAEIDGSVMPPPIGLPVFNYQCYVLDRLMHPQPVGVVGELHIGGAGVARGYLSQPGLTAQRFVRDPFRPGDPGARLYKTGDLVRRLPDGQIQFLGRMDGQVKLHGLRIELGEIETVLAGHPSVAQAVVTVFEDKAGAKHLVAYVRPEPGVEELHAGELRRHLANWVPSYMVPNHVVRVDTFPLNNNGKIDKKALPMPHATEAAVTYAPPTNLLETLVVDTYIGVLQVDRVGIDDSFFDIGGNSLQAMRLIARLRDDLAIDLDVTALFLSPTPRQLAARIEDSFGEADRSGGREHVVELAGTDARPALFVVHAIGGTVHGYVPFAHALAGAYHVYGIEAGEPAPEATIAELAARYVDAVREVQPRGPYRVAGWSLGGLVAYEMARLLEEEGEEVAQLVLLDAPFAIPHEPVLPDEQLAAEFVADAARTVGVEVPAGASDSAASVEAQVDWLAGRLAGSPEDAGVLRGELRRRLEVFGSLRRMLSGHRPQGAVKTDVLLVGAAESPNAVHQPHWPEVLAGDVTSADIPCDHYALLQHPHVREVAAVVAHAARPAPVP